jgi:hypothetical protein
MGIAWFDHFEVVNLHTTVDRKKYVRIINMGMGYDATMSLIENPIKGGFHPMEFRCSLAMVSLLSDCASVSVKL